MISAFTIEQYPDLEADEFYSCAWLLTAECEDGRKLYNVQRFVHGHFATWDVINMWLQYCEMKFREATNE